MLRVAIAFVMSPWQTWTVFCLNFTVATWSWFNVLSPVPLTNPFIVSTEDLDFELWPVLVLACVTNLVWVFMLIAYLMRHQLYMMHFAYQMEKARDLPLRPHLLEYMMSLADKHQVGGQFRGFLSNYDPDEMPSVFVAVTQLQSMIEEDEETKVGPF
jgi:hypothetical protein